MSSATLDHFHTHGWVRIPGAFSAGEAAAMCDVIWAALAQKGIDRHDSSTWTVGRPEHLQHLKSEAVFQSVGSARTIDAIDEVFEGRSWQRPRDWGAFFLQFPTGRDWDVPHAGWHIDGDYTARLVQPGVIKLHAMLTDVGPRGGGVVILSGSHRLVHRWFSEHPPPQRARAVHLRRSLERHPYVRDLCRAGDPQARVSRFQERIEEVDGIPLQVVENTGSAGDVILMHSLLLHAGAPAAHLGTQPRFILNQGLYEQL